MMATLSPDLSDLLTEVSCPMKPAGLVTDSNLSDSLGLRKIALDRPDLCPNRVAAGLGSHCLAFRLMLMKVYQPVVNLSRAKSRTRTYMASASSGRYQFPYYASALTHPPSDDAPPFVDEDAALPNMLSRRGTGQDSNLDDTDCEP